MKLSTTTLTLALFILQPLSAVGAEPASPDAMIESFASIKGTVEGRAIRLRKCQFRDTEVRRSLQRVVSLYDDIRAPVNARISRIVDVLKRGEKTALEKLKDDLVEATIAARIQSFTESSDSLLASGTCNSKVLWKEFAIATLTLAPAAYELLAKVLSSPMDDATRARMIAALESQKVTAWERVGILTAQSELLRDAQDRAAERRYVVLNAAAIPEGVAIKPAEPSMLDKLLGYLGDSYRVYTYETADAASMLRELNRDSQPVNPARPANPSRDRDTRGGRP